MRYAERNSVYGINKAGLIKRIAAFFLDFVIFALVTVGVCSLVLTITDYDGYREKLEEKYEYHGVYEPIDPSIPLEEQVVGAFCVPEKDCSQTSSQVNENPCEVFSHIKFPVNEFFPPRLDIDDDCSCGC